MDKLEERENKGLYKGAKNGKITNVVGVDINFPEPINSDLIIDNNKDKLNFDQLAGDILNSSFFKGWL